jgi:hypothetical protein
MSVSYTTGHRSTESQAEREVCGWRTFINLTVPAPELSFANAVLRRNGVTLVARCHLAEAIAVAGDTGHCGRVIRGRVGGGYSLVSGRLSLCRGGSCA